MAASLTIQKTKAVHHELNGMALLSICHKPYFKGSSFIQLYFTKNMVSAVDRAVFNTVRDVHVNSNKI